MGNIGKTLSDQLRRNPAQIETLTARNHGRKHLVDFGCGEDEFCMGRRFFNRLEQSVPCALGKHVHFVNDVNLVFGRNGKMKHVFTDFTCLVHLRMGRGVDFNDIHIRFVRDGFAGGTFAAGLAVNRTFAVERLGENSRRCGFADSARPHKQICMCNMPCPDGIFQCSCDMLLSDHVGKSLRTPFSGCYLIRHFRLPVKKIHIQIQKSESSAIMLFRTPGSARTESF